MAQNDEIYDEDRKLFVGGLPQEVSQDDLKEYFEQFGEIDSVKLKMDPMTGRSRGFAFLLYVDPASIEKAADGSEHKLKGKAITVKKADIKTGKVYVGKLPEEGIDEEVIKEHFSQYGAIAEVIRPIDKSKNNEPKNFCFVTFERERVAKKLIEEGTCTIMGTKMQIKQVTPNPRDPSSRGRGGYGGSPWMNQGWGGQGGWGAGGGQWGQDGGYGGYGGAGGGQWGQDGGYGGYGGADGSWGGQAWGGASGGTWSTGGRGGGGKMRGGRGGRGGGGGRGRGGKTRPY